MSKFFKAFRKHWKIYTFLVVVVVAALVGVFSGSKKASPADAQKYYLAEGAEACREAFLLASPALDDAQKQRIQDQINRIGPNNGPTPIRVMEQICTMTQKSKKLSGAKKDCLEEISRVVSALGHLPVEQEAATTEAEKQELKERFPLRFQREKRNLEKALKQSRELRSE